MDQFSSWNSFFLLSAKLTFWVGMIEELFGELLVQYPIYSDLFWQGEPILGSAYASPNIGSPLPNNQISDSSRPNNCINCRSSSQKSAGSREHDSNVHFECVEFICLPHFVRRTDCKVYSGEKLISSGHLHMCTKKTYLFEALVKTDFG